MTIRRLLDLTTVVVLATLRLLWRRRLLIVVLVVLGLLIQHFFFRHPTVIEPGCTYPPPECNSPAMTHH